MRSRYLVMGIALICGQALTACTPNVAGGPYESTALRLLVSDEQRDGRSGPEALFEGVLLASEDECLQGHAPDGTIYNIEFPAGTHINDAGEVDIGFATIPLGEDISLGGGYSERHELVESLPEACRKGVTFMVYSS